MDISKITNANLFEIDWSARDRAAFLRSIPAPKPLKKGFLAPGLSAFGVHGKDVSLMDRRSVKAQLAGRGDFRATWWNLNEWIHRMIAPTASTESIMYDFHSRHQTWTLAVLELKNDHRVITQAILSGGIIAGLRCALERALRSEPLKK